MAQVPLACYPFTSTDPGDASGNGHHGTVQGATPMADRFGHPNEAYYFDGEDDRVELPALGDLIPGNELSVSFWLKADASESDAALLTQPDDAYDRFSLAPHYNHNGENTVFWDFGDIFTGGRSSIIPFAFSDDWQHWVFTHSEMDDNMSIYLDGVLIDSEDHHSSITDRSKPVWIGGGFTTGLEFFFHGAIDDVMFFDEAMSASTVAFVHADQLFAAPCSQVGFAAHHDGSGPAIRPSILQEGPVTIDWDGTAHGGRIAVIDMEGRIVHAETFADSDLWAFGAGQLAPGCYSIRCFSGGDLFTARFVKR